MMGEKKLVPKRRFEGFTEEWRKQQLNSIFNRIRNGFVGTATPYYVNFGNFYLQSNNVKNGKINRETEVFINNEFYKKQEDKLLRTGDLVMVQSGHVGHTAVIPQELDKTAAHALIMFQGYKKEANPYFYNYQFQTIKVKKRLSSVTTGNTIRHILASDMGFFEMNVTSIKEQQKIGQFFKHLDEMIALQQRKIDKTKALKSAYLAEMFPAEGEHVPKRRYEGFVDDWKIYQFENIIDMYNNLRIPVTASDRIPGNTPYYGANGIQDYVQGSTHEGEFVLIAEDGANDLTNYPVQYVNGKAWVNNHAHIVSGKENIIDNLFLVSRMKSMNISKWLVGGGRAKLNAEVLKIIQIKIPSFQEQEQIGLLFKHLDEMIATHQQKLEKLKVTKQAFLHEMFV